LLQAIGIRGQANTNVMARFDRVGLHNFVIYLGSAAGGVSDWKACQGILRARTNYALPPLPQQQTLRPAKDNGLSRYQCQANETIKIGQRNFVFTVEFDPQFILLY
jgi:hypothetical protein